MVMVHGCTNGKLMAQSKCTPIFLKSQMAAGFLIIMLKRKIHYDPSGYQGSKILIGNHRNKGPTEPL